jgi:signal transduction histidine kinase
MTDRGRLKVVLKNLISNAINYSDPNKTESYIRISIEQENGFYSIQIADNGIGIPEDQLEHIFEMFYRANESSQGSGLGLYIVKETIEKLKGKVEVESSKGEGSTFKIKIPHKLKD